MKSYSPCRMYGGPADGRTYRLDDDLHLAWIPHPSVNDNARLPTSQEDGVKPVPLTHGYYRYRRRGASTDFDFTGDEE